MCFQCCLTFSYIVLSDSTLDTLQSFTSIALRVQRMDRREKEEEEEEKLEEKETKRGGPKAGRLYKEVVRPR